MPGLAPPGGHVTTTETWTFDPGHGGGRYRSCDPRWGPSRTRRRHSELKKQEDGQTFPRWRPNASDGANIPLKMASIKLTVWKRQSRDQDQDQSQNQNHLPDQDTEEPHLVSTSRS